MAIRSWRVFASQLGVSVSTLKRMRHSDSKFPRKIRISDQRVGFRAEDCDAYEDLIVARQEERDTLRLL